MGIGRSIRFAACLAPALDAARTDAAVVLRAG